MPTAGARAIPFDVLSVACVIAPNLLATVPPGSAQGVAAGWI